MASVLTRCSLQADKAWCRSKPGALRADPVPRLPPKSSKSDHHHRPMVFFGQPAGHDSDHALMPASICQAPVPRSLAGSNRSLICLLAER